MGGNIPVTQPLTTKSPGNGVVTALKQMQVSDDTDTNKDSLTADLSGQSEDSKTS